jgi:septal ring factor EnvC (AmiA/AmiB activator)
MKRPYCCFYLVFCVFALTCVQVSPAFAKDTDEIHQKELKDVQSTLDKEKKLLKDLERQKAKAEKEIEKIQAELISLSAKIRKIQIKKNELGIAIDQTKQETDTLNSHLKGDYKQLKTTLSALRQLGDTPPYISMLRLEKPLDKARRFGVMEHVVPPLIDHAKTIQGKMQQKSVLLNDLTTQQNTLAELQQQSQDEYASFSTKLEEREKVTIALDHDFKEHQKKSNSLAKKARNITDLIAKLNEEEKRAEQEAQKIHEAENKNQSLKKRAPSFRKTPKSSGKYILPTTGTILYDYDDTDEIGAKSNGITQKSNSNDLITAPQNGIVRFAGHFKEYGSLIIIEHSGNYHSLVGGPLAIQVKTGQSVALGEPIATVDSVPNPKVYFEIRKNNKPINPKKLVKY